MKKFIVNKHIVLLLIGCMFLSRYQHAFAQVDKAMKYAWFFDYEQAEKFLTDSSNKMDDAMVLELAEALYQQGKYAQALYYYKMADAKGTIQSKQAQRNYVYASAMMHEKSPYYKKSNYFKSNYFLYSVLDTFPGNSLNEDFSTQYWNGMLFVTTSKQTLSNGKAFQYVLTKMPYLDVYPYTEKGARLIYPNYFPKVINTSMHDGPIAVSKDTNLIVLTRNYSKPNAAGAQNLYLAYFVRDAKRKWSQPVTMNFCQAGFSVQHPFFNESEGMLYFSSDMPGGFGGYDLYKTSWNGTEWTPPQNLGQEINSEFDEVFPSFTFEGELVYASNHMETTGGLDMVIFSQGNRYLLNEPFNSVYDDFGFIFKSKSEGYFSSNRFTSKFDDNIFHFTLSEPLKQSLYVKVFDSKSGMELDEVQVTCSSPEGLGAVTLLAKANQDNLLLRDTVDARKPLSFNVSKAAYLGYTSTDNQYWMREGKLVKEIYLERSPIYAADDYLMHDNNDRSSKFESLFSNDSLLGKLVQAKDVFFQVISNPLEEFVKIDPEDARVKISSGAVPGSYQIVYSICNRNQPAMCDTAAVAISIRGRIVDALENLDTVVVPGMNAVNDTAFVTINGGYALNVRNNDKVDSKKANLRNSVIRNEKSDHPDITLNRRTGVVNVKKGVPAGTYHLSYDIHERGNKEDVKQTNVTVVVRNFDQIPGRGANSGKMQTENTAVFFNNDEPKPMQVYRPGYNYQNSLESFIEHFPEFFKRSIDNKTNLDTFFTYQVEGGYHNLNRALKLISQKLNQGVQVEIAVSAYCSPIASTEYNNKLSTRRIISVMRYVKKWNEGALYDAIESNRITFWEHAVGELEAPEDVSSDFNKPDESVFGIKASRERRVSVTVKIIGSK